MAQLGRKEQQEVVEDDDEGVDEAEPLQAGIIKAD